MKKPVLPAAFAIFLTAGLPFASAQPIAPAQLQEQAAMYYRAGRYQESAQLYKQLADTHPNDTDILKDFMWALWNAEQPQEAMSVASKIVAQNPKDLDALNVLARTNQQTGDNENAIENYRKILGEESNNGRVKVRLARLYTQAGNLAEAEKLLSEASADAPGIRQIYPELAKVQTQEEKYGAAAESWAKAAHYWPERAGEYKIQQAKALFQEKENNAALAVLRGLLSDKTQKRRALDMLVNNAMENGRQDVAIDLLENNLSPSAEGDENRLLKLARIYADEGQLQDALNTLDREMALDSGQVSSLLLKGNILFDYFRNYAEAINLFRKSADQTPDNPKIYPKLATAAYLLGFYNESARAWAKAAELSPARVDYKFKQAQALYFDKQYNAANKILYSLLENPDQRLYALDFLLGDFVARGDLPGAASLLERYPMNGERLFELGTVYRNQGKFKLSLSMVDKAIALQPDDASAYILKAQCLSALNKNKQLLVLYEKLHKANPTSTFYTVRLSEAQYNVGHKKDALRTLREARSTDPTDPNLVLREADYCYDIGEYEKAKAMLVTWMKKNKEPSLGVLVYHGLTPFSRDPLLLHPYHMTTAVFEDQMHGLKQAGFTAVTADQVKAWSAGEPNFPKHPVMITFDDGREDSFKNADPILKTLGMKATMFTIMNNTERNLQNYANWSELLAWKNTGRWDLQAHGDLGHTHIIVNANGDKAFFLTRQMWLSDKKRVENDHEWRQRVSADHSSAKEKLTEQTGKAPIAFAFPEGNYAQFNLTSAPAPQENIDLVKKYFTFAFHEDEYGMNVRSRDPGLYTRYTPGQNQKGADLARFLSDENPFALARKTLLQWALWEEKPREAFAWLEELKKGGASKYCLLMEEARIHTALNDLASAEQLIDQASKLDAAPPAPENNPDKNVTPLPANIEGLTPAEQPAQEQEPLNDQ